MEHFLFTQRYSTHGASEGEGLGLVLSRKEIKGVLKERRKDGVRKGTEASFNALKGLIKRFRNRCVRLDFSVFYKDGDLFDEKAEEGSEEFFKNSPEFYETETTKFLSRELAESFIFALSPRASMMFKDAVYRQYFLTGREVDYVRVDMIPFTKSWDRITNGYSRFGLWLRGLF